MISNGLSEGILKRAGEQASCEVNRCFSTRRAGIIQPMEIITFLIDFILHVDKHLEAFVLNYGLWVYALLFLIIFVETGVVVMPFLPGDSLLFVVKP